MFSRRAFNSLLSGLLMVSLVSVFAMASPTRPAIAAGTTNFAWNTTSTATSTDPNVTNVGPEKATDGNTATRWAANPAAGSNQSLSTDLRFPVIVSRVVVNWHSQSFATSYTIDVSDDGSTWTTAYSTTSGNGGKDDITVAPRAVAARYVRVHMTQQNPGQTYSIADFEVSGERASQSALSSSTDPNWASQVPSSNVIDGDTTTRWQSGAGANQWIYIDLYRPINLRKVQINWVAGLHATTFQVEVSEDTVNWSSVFSTTSGTGGVSNIAVTPRAARYVRVAMTQGVTSAYSIWEIQAFGDKTRAVASQTDPNWATLVPADNVVDGNASTRWAAYTDTNVWIYVDLGRPRDVNRVVIDWVANQHAAAYLVRASDDAVHWTTLFSTTSGNGGTDDLTLPTTRARYVGVHMTQRGVPANPYSISEIEVFGNASSPVIDQASLAHLDLWPNHPLNYAYFDWKQRALDYYAFAFDWTKTSQFPTIAWNTRPNFLGSAVFAMPDYYGDNRLLTKPAGLFTRHSAVLGASLVGMNMSSVTVNGNTYNYVDQLRSALDPTTDVIVVNPEQPTQSNWWFDLIGNMTYYMLGDLYPNEAGMSSRLQGMADAFYDMVVDLGGANVDFDHQGYDFRNQVPVPTPAPGHDNSDAGLGVATIEYWAYQEFGDPKYLDAARWAMDYYERHTTNKSFDNFTNFGPYVAARINAETGTSYDTTKYLQWLLEGNDANIGMINKSYAGHDFYGLMGFKHSYGIQERGYFYESVQNVFMLPAVKYDHRLAETVGKWILNLSSNARYFFPDQMPATNQHHGSTYVNAPEKVIAYEALEVQNREGVAHFAEGDPHRWANDPNLSWIIAETGPQVTDLGLYGTSWTGMLGSVVQPTNVSQVLQLDVNKLDFYKGAPGTYYPTYLYYNPHSTPQQINIPLSSASDLYDVISGQYVATNASGTTSFTVGAEDAVLLVVAPANSTRTFNGSKTLLDGVTVGYQLPNP